MTLTIRLDPDLERDLANASAQSGQPKSQIVKRGLREYLARLSSPKTPYELGADLFDRGPESGEGNLSDKAIIRARMSARIRAENHR
ncbi:MAG: ribbon-helix-helix domain-containing protein [Candidatus Nitricoxidivorans perseverans]|uniref:Ribbon-helix-helix domain-containing protein n=1 Tax=Candidatus Nitricoxidivorans perseverans TaxID=2975601 RepID=A0AA49FMU6_9PROT|nr:MAG: ribbon-helix-helix domain-containing protein [Candidatus Nitricoxidivorans perseverans]